MKFTFTAALVAGYRLFKSRYVALLGACVVFLLISAAMHFLMELAASPLLVFLIYLLLVSPFSAGIFLLAVLHLRDESPGLATLFVGFTRYVPLVCIGAFYMLLSLLAMLAVLVFEWSFGGGESPGLRALAATFFVLAFLLVLARLVFAPLLCVDPRRRFGLRESFAASWRATGPVFWPWLGLLVVLSLVGALTLLVFILPFVLLGLPFVIAVGAAAYRLIFDAHSMDGEAEEFPPPATG